MANPYPAVIQDSNLAERLGVSITFTDPGNQPGGGGGGTVDSVFGRIGTVVAQSGDYTAAQVNALPSNSDLSAIATANPTAANVAMNAHKLTGLAAATLSTDAASLANTLDQFGAPQANTTWNAKKITGLANGTAAQDAAAFGQVPTTAAQVGALASTADLSTIASTNPTAANWSNNTKKITSLANGTISTDAAAFGQIPTTAAQVGALASTSTLDAIATANPTAANISMSAHKLTGLAVATAATDAASLANTLDQFGAPAAAVAFNAKKITGLANGTVSTDGAAFGQIPTSASSIGGMLTATYDAANIAQQVLGTTATQTTTNKRITKRVGTVASSATPTINTDNVDFFSITALTVDITSMTTNLSGTPTDAQTLWLAITGTAARAITWGASFEASTIALPTTTVTTNRLDVGFVWNTATSKWRCVATC